LSSPPVISLTTDFGLDDWFVGTMKGVILDRCPDSRIVDLSHHIPPGDLQAGAFALAASYKFFPKQTVHLVVVDPGVGSDRNSIAVKTQEFTFVGPDNGVLSWALALESIESIHRLENLELFRGELSNTFHGRDVFAPIAAELAGGKRIEEVGPETSDYLRLHRPEPIDSGGSIQGEVVYIDRFGNAMTNIPGNSIGETGRATFGDGKECDLRNCYADSPHGVLLAVKGSTGFIEIAVNGGDAATTHGLKVGDEVSLARQ
tara:strand:- start:15677 stop:16456 length:780 start_codon:yes stop_codon:yes gene_type:complete